jgi:hypothetical protein
MKRFDAALAVAVAVVAATALGCSSAPSQRPIKTTPVDAGTGSMEAGRKFLQGRWSLISFEVFPPGQTPITVSGSGSLLYDDFGNLSMEIRTSPSTGEALGRAGIVIQQGVISSQGRTILDMQNKRLTYQIEGQPPAGAPAGPLASSRPRYWQVDGDVLTLTTKDDAGRALSIGKWKRVP